MRLKSHLLTKKICNIAITRLLPRMFWTCTRTTFRAQRGNYKDDSNHVSTYFLASRKRQKEQKESNVFATAWNLIIMYKTGTRCSFANFHDATPPTGDCAVCISFFFFCIHVCASWTCLSLSNLESSLLYHSRSFHQLSVLTLELILNIIELIFLSSRVRNKQRLFHSIWIQREVL